MAKKKAKKTKSKSTKKMAFFVVLGLLLVLGAGILLTRCSWAPPSSRQLTQN